VRRAGVFFTAAPAPAQRSIAGLSQVIRHIRQLLVAIAQYALLHSMPKARSGDAMFTQATA